MQKTKIEWTDFVWNPIRGLCPVNCKTPDGKEYCYARRMYKRFKWQTSGGLRLETEQIRNITKPSKIFVCSTFEIFHPIVPQEWLDKIFAVIQSTPRHTFQVLTKMPENIDREMPDNVWLGVSVTEHKDISRVRKLMGKQARIKFVSIEPFLKAIFISSEIYLQHLDWIIMGRLTEHGEKYNPKKTWIEGFVVFAKKNNIPIFLKDNLKEIWEEPYPFPEPLIQEFPQ